MKRTIFSLVMIVTLFTIIGCASASQSESMTTSADGMVSNNINTDSSYAFSEESSDAMGDESMAGESMDDEMAEESEVGTASLGERKIIREATLRVETADVTDAMNWATALSVRSGGYTTHSNSWMVNEQQHASFSFAVPVERFEEAMEQSRLLGKVLSENISTRDVTAQYVDVEARIENLEITTERVRAFLIDTTDIEQTLEVNRELTRLEGDLNSLKGQRNVLSRQTAFSTINLELTPLPVPPTTAQIAGEVTAWAPLQTFNNALTALLSVMQLLVSALIWLVVVGGPVVIVAALFLTLFRRLRPALNHQNAEEAS